MAGKSKQDKAARHEALGDEFLAKGKPAKALSEYKKALDIDADRPGLYDKLIKAHEQAPGDWKMEDFTQSVSWAMKKQEQEHPPIRQVHARLKPEWKKATELALDVLYAESEETANEKIEQLVGMGEIATRAAIGLLLDLKKAAQPKEKGKK